MSSMIIGADDTNASLAIEWRAVKNFVFPTTRRDAVKVPWAAAEGGCSGKFLKMLNSADLAETCPLELLGVTEFITEKYCIPHREEIAKRGRHLLLIKVYGAKYQALFWWMPHATVVEQYGSVAGGREKQVENYPDLVESYPINSAFAVHIEMYARHGGNKSLQEREAIGMKVYAGGFCIQMPDYSNEKDVEESMHFATTDREGLEKIAKKREAARKKKARQKAKKKEAKAETKRAEEEAAEAEEAAEEELRRGAKMKTKIDFGQLMKNMQIDKGQDTPPSMSSPPAHEMLSSSSDDD